MNHEIIMAMMDKMAQTGLTKFSYKEGNVEIKIENTPSVVTASPVVPAAPVQTVATPAAETAVSNATEMVSPLIGTFYASPSPEMPPYVKAGDVVKKGQVLGIVEAMKLMNEIECEFDGTIEKILVENEQTVEYGQPLFLIKEN